MSPGPKNRLESCVSRFSTICAKNLVLKLKIDKVTVIRVEQITLSSVPPLYVAADLGDPLERSSHEAHACLANHRR
jgi:hypothetical protein